MPLLSQAGNFPVFMFALVAVFIIGMIVFGIIQTMQRRKELAEWAAERGWRFDPAKNHGFYDRFGFDCLNQGTDDRYAFNIIEGDYEGRPITAFDYHYATYSQNKNGRTKHSHHFSAVILHCRVPFKPLRIRRETFFDKVANFFGRNTINFESAEFSKQFHVESPDRRWAHDVIHTRVMDLLLKAPNFEIQMRNNCIIAARSSRMPRQKFEKALRLLHTLIESLPDYVRQDLQSHR